MTTPMRTRRLVRASALAAVAVLGASCAKPDNLEVGLKDYSTDVVYGGPTTTAPPPPVPFPAAELTPAFPSFIAPPPPPPSFSFTSPPPPPPPVFIDEPCPPADPGSSAGDPPATFSGGPAKGVYPYRLSGEFKVGGTVRGKLPATGERSVTAVTNRSDGTFAFDVAVPQFGATTTSTYDLVRRVNDPTLDGLYLTRTVQRRADGGTEEFTPASPGLRILPTPIRAGTTWSSVAVDPIRATSMSLEGRVVDIRQVDACGILVKGWASQVTITVRRAGTAANAADYVINATYVIAPQLGGVFVADDVTVKGTDRGAAVESTAVAAIMNVSPIRAS